MMPKSVNFSYYIYAKNVTNIMSYTNEMGNCSNTVRFFLETSLPVAKFCIHIAKYYIVIYLEEGEILHTRNHCNHQVYSSIGSSLGILGFWDAL